MKPFLLIKTFVSLVYLSSIGCSSAYQTMKFDKKMVPVKPNYSESKSWAVLPGEYPDLLQNFKKLENNKKADVFYIYPTLLSDKRIKDWNANIWSPSIREDVQQFAVKNQGSAWLNAGDLYVPFYRQVHYRIFVKDYGASAASAWEIAYSDVKSAFQYYLKYYNKGKPIIIASHSQGSMHAKRLIKEFFDQKPLQEKLIAAYLIGTRIFPDEFESIQPMETSDAVGGFVSWNAYKINKLPKNYIDWYKGGVTTNPISWDLQKSSQLNEHKGILNKDMNIYPKSLRVEVNDGILWTSLPYVPRRFLLSLIHNYHFADINLFWKDIELNAITRVDAWYKKKSDEN